LKRSWKKKNETSRADRRFLQWVMVMGWEEGHATMPSSHPALLMMLAPPSPLDPSHSHNEDLGKAPVVRED
jgi:hypothetical protein